MPTIQSTDVATEIPAGDLDLDDAANAFLAKFGQEADEDASKKKKPSEKGETSSEDDVKPQDEQDPDTEETETDEDGESPSDEDEDTEETEESEETEETEDEKKYAESDDIIVKVKEGDKEHEVPISKLKRLFGQEAALTRKSQEVATLRTQVEQSQAKSLAALDLMVKRAKEAADPYRNVNWVALAKDPNVTAEQVNALQEMARSALDNETFLTQQLDGYMGHIQEQQKTERAKAAQECIKALTDEKSATHIKGWNENLYNDLRAFGVEVGLNKAQVDQLTDPAAFKLLHMAMQFHKGSKKVQTVKVNKAPKKIVKTSAAVTKTSSGSKVNVDRNKAVSKLKQTGSLDDAADAFLASFTNKD